METSFPIQGLEVAPSAENIMQQASALGIAAVIVLFIG